MSGIFQRELAITVKRESYGLANGLCRLVRSTASFLPALGITTAAGIALSLAVTPVVNAKNDPNRLVVPGEVQVQLPAECRTQLALQLSEISVHANDPLLESNLDLATRCGAASIEIYNNLVGTSAQNRMRGENIGPIEGCLLYTSPSPRDLSTSRMPSSA